jgi:hypothetical protein
MANRIAAITKDLDHDLHLEVLMPGGVTTDPNPQLRQPGCSQVIAAGQVIAAISPESFAAKIATKLLFRAAVFTLY